MRRTALSVFVMPAIAMMVLTGCGEPEKSTTASAPTTTTTSAAPASAAAAPSPSVTTLDAATKKGCTALLASIKETDKQVAETEKIGGPVGHVAVGAAYIAGSAELSASSIGITDLKVREAAGKVGDEMSALDEAWQKNPGKKPSEKALNSAIAELKAACAAS